MDNLYQKPVRPNYNLSLRQRNEKAANVETVSLLKTIKENENNNNNHDTVKSKKEVIPEWVSSVADCMAFGTNINAYNKLKTGSGSCPMFDDKRKRKSSMRNKDKLKTI